MHIKICGVTTRAALNDAVTAGATMIGLVFFEKSPRNLSIEQARAMALDAPVGVVKVGLFVDPSDGLLDAVLADVPLDMLQLHGNETPNRVAEIKARFGLPIMKAIGVTIRDDIKRASAFEAADIYLFDAKAPADANLPGGNGHPFDWSVMRGVRLAKPWLLAGGLSPENVRDAIAISGAQGVDVSSGVESAPGIKDKERVIAFTKAAKEKR